MNAVSDCPLALSLGALREGCAAIEAFGDLLASRRVGPRALARARVATLEACVTLVGALGPFERIVAASLGDDCSANEILSRLCERLKLHMSAIMKALCAATPLSARRRLELETLFRDHRAGIKDCVALCDLAVASATIVPVELHLGALMQRYHHDRAVDDGAVVLELDVDETPIRTGRRLLAGLIELSVSLVCRDGASRARLSATTRPDGTFVVRVVRAPSDRSAEKSVVLLRRGELDLGLDVARMAARRAGIDVAFDDATNEASIVLAHVD